MTTALKTTIFAKLAIIIFYVLLAFFLIKPLFAQDATSTATPSKVTTTLQQKAAAQKAKVETRIETKKANIQQRIENTKERIASRAAALKEKLQTFKDKKKAEIAERVNTNLNRINTNQTDQMLKHLNTMSTILDKVENLINQDSASIKNMSATRAVILDARAMIASTSAVVEEQAGKDYTIVVTSESKIRTDAQAQRTNLHNDLTAARKQVIDSKQKVAEVIRTAKSERGVKEGTTSGQQ